MDLVVCYVQSRLAYSFFLLQNFPELPANSPSSLFITFPLDAGLYAQRPVTQGRVAPKVCCRKDFKVKEKNEIT